ncbi:MAG: 4Fe-4S dicluster domain-containing protein [Deltaproteobacteria bacterium]|nr:MAG: 4Fe-4S dicluster domain-containing protein [Deltaproteobacteria bacterium]
MKLPLAGQSRPWRSVEELQSPPAPSRELGPAEPPSRREVLQLLGASAALATMGGCLKPPDEKILPYTKQPPEVTPGNPLHYATCSTLDGRATGLLVTASEGRPTKVEGSPEHPSSKGGIGVLEQAQLLSLYDPQRLKVVQYKSELRSWRDFLATMIAKSRVLRDRRGEGLRFLMEPSSSPLIAHLRQRLLEVYPRARFSSWSAIPLQQIHDGAQLAFGSAYETRIDLSRAQAVASLDADFLSAMPGNARPMKDWAARRVPPNMARLYAVEAHLSVTGMNADHRLRLKPSQVHRFGLALLGRLVPRHAALAKRFSFSAEELRFADVLARDLQRAGAGAAVLVGARQPPVLHAAMHAINAALGSSVVSQAKPVLHEMDAGPRALRVLAEEMRRGAVDTLIMTAYNPVYGATSDINFAMALSQVNTSVYRTLYADETAERAGWVLPAAHPLESWGDARAHDGTISFQQPLIAPLYAGVSEAEMLAALFGEGDRTAYTQLREFWQARVPELGRFDLTWEKWIADGFIPGTAVKAESPAVNHDAVLAEAMKVPPAEKPGLEINVVADTKVLDGRFGNNGWLQELPDPVTKLTWENAALLSPATAAELGVEQGDLVDLTLRGPPARAPVVIAPGHADGAVTVAIGYGRRSDAETLCKGIGFDTSTLRHSDLPWFAPGLALVATGRKARLAQTQQHHSMEGRIIAVSAALPKLRETEEMLEEQRGAPLSFHRPWDYSKGYRWGMAIDLSRCTGCSSCVVACQAENNVPVVGKDRVWRSREMHWLRVDRYFLGEDAANPGVVFQPLMCVHCESAPCEYVCPVNATVHSDEGLNEMVYNRCVGTRYCSNNCPYKVRRFNFFSYTSEYSDQEKMAFNPDVTVRSRGVMEKCTYCVQRIERARIHSRVEGREIRDGEIQTACQQACPADAIVFGDLNDSGSRVSRLLSSERRYDLLHELGTRPRTGYLARVMNPNPELA